MDEERKVVSQLANQSFHLVVTLCWHVLVLSGVQPMFNVMNIINTPTVNRYSRHKAYIFGMVLYVQCEICLIFSLPFFLPSLLSFFLSFLKERVGLGDHLAIFMFQLLNQSTCFHDIWYEYYAIGNHTKF